MMLLWKRGCCGFVGVRAWLPPVGGPFSLLSYLGLHRKTVVNSSCTSMVLAREGKYPAICSQSFSIGIWGRTDVEALTLWACMVGSDGFPWDGQGHFWSTWKKGRCEPALGALGSISVGRARWAILPTPREISYGRSVLGGGREIPQLALSRELVV